MDLRPYFQRIGYSGPVAPTLAVLAEVMSRHVQTIPFENLDVLLGRRIFLDVDSLQRKLVQERRGGYCFEQNGLFLAVLEAIGFQVRPLSARVRYQRPRDYLPPRTHLFARVELDGESWLADVGVGSMSLTAPLRLYAEAEQSTPHEPRRIVKEGALYYHQVRFGESWHDVSEFTLEEMPPIDRELANWYTSTHPDSHFKARLQAARAAPDGARVTLLNRDLTRRARDGGAQVRTLQHPDELVEVLREDFGLHFPTGTRFTCPALEWP